MSERKPIGLDYLIHPLTAEEFVEHWFEQRWLHVHREERDHFAGLFSFVDMDRIIAHGDLQADYTITLVKGDVAIHKLGQSGRQDYRGGHDLKEASLSPDGLYREVADGNTVRVSFTERFSHPVWEMAGELERQLNANIVTNVFLTPASSRAFSTHFDAHDVFILQLEGHKNWEVYDPPADLPMEKPVRVRPELFTKRLPFDGRASLSAAKGQVPTQIRLERGDFLYVPRGFSHRAWAGDELSMHLTVEIRAFTWHELFAHAIARHLPHDLLLRRGLPPGFAADDGRVDEAVAERDGLAAAVEAALAPERLAEVVEDLANRYVYSRNPVSRGQLADLAGAERVDPSTRLRIRPGVTARLACKADGLILFFSGHALDLPERSRSMLEFMLARRRFAVGELPTELGDESRVVLARHLLKSGFLTLEPAGAAGLDEAVLSNVAVNTGARS
ncbi:MAG: JmjC domain-containing protein [Thermoanaerobaculia bacterium]